MIDALINPAAGSGKSRFAPR